ncbi:hypothetical protein SteCoe_4836 [Stentor coeruleus]|uniref:Uncharacterized protein n=1 Tax=Stentor coeruleus TaxID=5963 RepID=A0A1R2CTU6_9CILI|nr:hypothetical protein SteCoe_4836 [Stentor coeruleus]
MGSLERISEIPERSDLKSMVESLQIALSNHKQHIANEVKDCLYNEISHLINQAFHNFSENYLKTILSLEKGVQLELQNLGFKLQTLENKSSDLLEKIKHLENMFTDKNKIIDQDIRNIYEKNACAQQLITSYKDIIKKLEDNYMLLNNEVVTVKENINSNKQVIISEFNNYLYQIRHEIEMVKLESYSKIQTESAKIQNNFFEFRGYFEQQLAKVGPSNQYEPEVKKDYYREKDLIDYINTGLSKQYEELSKVRSRVEMLEINYKNDADLRKSRNN